MNPEPRDEIPTSGSNLRDELLTLWSIQESLLQSYRAMFITVSALLLGFGVMIMISAGQPANARMLGVGITAGLALIVVRLWIVICRARGRHVSFLQALLVAVETGRVPEVASTSLLRRWQRHDEDERVGGTPIVLVEGQPETTWDVYRDPEFLADAGSTARTWLGTMVPLSFVLAWLIVAAATFFPGLSQAESKTTSTPARSGPSE